MTEKERRYQMGWLDVKRQVQMYELYCGDVTTRIGTPEEIERYKLLGKREAKNQKIRKKSDKKGEEMI